VLLWPVAVPKNRIGGSPGFSFAFAFQFSGETLDTPDENGGCGYDFASGVHKYLYAADDPVNLDDPSGNDYGDFSINLSTIFLPFLKVPTLATSIVNLTGASALDPIGRPPIALYDADIDGQLNAVYQKIRRWEETHGPVNTESPSTFYDMMRGSTVDTIWYRYPGGKDYYQYFGTEHPKLQKRTFRDTDINYLGFGEGWCAGGVSDALHAAIRVRLALIGKSPSDNTFAAADTGYDWAISKFPLPGHNPAPPPIFPPFL
jgi:hypothetical protein